MPNYSNMIRYIFSPVGRRAVRNGLGVLSAGLLTVLLASPASANQQGPGGGGSVLNILLLVLIAYFLVRMFRRRSGGDNSRHDRWNNDARNQRDRNARPMDRHEAARQMWDVLSSDSEGDARATTPTGTADGFNEEEFLEGAKLFFSRFQQAGSRQDFDDLRGFMSEEVYEEAVAMAERDASFGPSEIMLLNARLMEVRSDGGTTFATVFYDAQIRNGVAGDHSEHVRAVWEFSRDDTVQGGLWTLHAINKVDQ